MYNKISSALCLSCSWCTLRLSRPGTLIPPHLSNRDPSYFLVSGLVFTVVNEPYLVSEYGNEWMSDTPVGLLDQLFFGQPAEPGEQVVVLGQVLADEATLGYEDVSNVQVSRSALHWLCGDGKAYMFTVVAIWCVAVEECNWKAGHPQSLC